MVHQKTFPGTPPVKDAGVTNSEGERLEKGIWNDMKTFNWASLEKKIAPEFQSIHNDGPRNRIGELELIKNLKLGNFTFSHFNTTRQGDTLIVTYTISVDETIDDRRLSGKASQRLSVWRNNNGQWEWIAHANLTSLGQR